MMPKRFFITLLFIAAVLFAVELWQRITPSIQSPPLEEAKTLEISVGEATIKAEVVSTSEEVMRGLGGRASLGENEGMWFDFGFEYAWGIWMKDMLIPIDIIWFDKDLRVITVAERVDPDTYPQVFTPSEKARYVLEVNAGFVEKSGLEVGNQVSVR